MNLNSQRELENTLKKLRLLERLHAEATADIQGDLEVRDTELESLQRQINQLKEEIARYEARHVVRG
jgi:flagellar biosynthesis chaperone FliJ